MTFDEWQEKWKVPYVGSVGEGWVPLLETLAQELSELGFDFSQVVQIKEKFGGLRFYHYSDSTDEVSDAIDRAEDASLKTCEDCGAPGKPRGGGWIRTLCDSCAAQGK